MEVDCYLDNLGFFCGSICNRCNKDKGNDGGSTFFRFYDDMDWYRKNLDNMRIHSGEVMFVKGNKGKDSHIDMQLMSYCKNVMLVTLSSFSYLAALLNRNELIGVVNGTSREV